MTELVAVDIGGTHARFALAHVDDEGCVTVDEPETLRTDDHASLQTAWEDFRGRKGGTLPPAVAMAIAGPVGNPADEGRVIRFTNNPWILRPGQIEAKLGASRYTIVNDFAAVAHAVAVMDEDYLDHLTGPDTPLPQHGTISVIGPGTGLGVAYFWRGGPRNYRVQASEGGHVDFAPLDPVEDSILARLRKRHRRVSVERVVSGPALADIYAALAALERKTVPEHDDRTLWKLGTEGTDSLAAAAVDRFCMALGSVAGDMALAHGSTGVAIAGGLGYRIRDTLMRSAFAERFRAKGRFENLMASIPVKLVTHPEPGLFGAAAAFAREHCQQ